MELGSVFIAHAFRRALDIRDLSRQAVGAPYVDGYCAGIGQYARMDAVSFAGIYRNRIRLRDVPVRERSAAHRLHAVCRALESREEEIVLVEVFDRAAGLA